MLQGGHILFHHRLVQCLRQGCLVIARPHWVGQAHQHIVAQGLAEQARGLRGIGHMWRSEEGPGVGQQFAIPAQRAGVGRQ